MDTVMITSSGPSEGKTSSTVNLAITLAKSDKKVLIVDCDLRKPSLHKVFGAPRAPGLTDALILSQYAKILALAVDISQKNKDAPKNTINRLWRVNAPIAGVLLTKFSTDQTDDYGYDNSYYYYDNYKAYTYGDEEFAGIEDNSNKG